MMIVLELETGLRTNREALVLQWPDIDLVNDVIRVRESKTPVREREVPLSARCKTELLRWRSLCGPELGPSRKMLNSSQGVTFVAPSAS